MTPETIQAIAALAAIVESLGKWPLALIIVVVFIGPWLFSFFINRGHEKRFEAVTKMYENNVRLVQCYEKLADGQNDTILLNTAKWTEVETKIDTNQFCPHNRTKKQHMEDVPR